MATIDTQLLTLFDPDDRHQRCDTLCDRRVYIRIIDSALCQNHIRNHSTHPDLDVHLFFPDKHAENIWNRPLDYPNTVKYIYCRNKASIDLIRQTYGRRFAHRIFTDDDLDFEIHHVHVTLSYSLGKQAPAESPERDAIMSTAIQDLDVLRHHLHQMMTDQTGEQPIERY